MGREEELQWLLEALVGPGSRHAAIAGLHGLGGVGKSELALQLADRYRDAFPAGCLWANLGTNRDDGERGAEFNPEVILRHTLLEWAVALDLEPSGEEALARLEVRVDRAIGQRIATHGRMLLVLDNMDAREVIEFFLERFPGASILVTSRQVALVEGADLSHVRLEGADLTGARLEGAVLTGARYDAATRWPEGIDPTAAGACLAGSHVRDVPGR